MTQGGPRPPPGHQGHQAPARLASIPRFARPSAEHIRALQAAGPFEIRLFKKVAQRPLMSVWEGEDKAPQRVLLTVTDASGTTAERTRIIRAAQALLPLAGTDGVQHVHRVIEEVDAFLSDYLGAGTAADLAVLRWSPIRRLEFACRMCAGLVALHESGIVHGCLCPDNILLNDDLYPVLTEAGMVSIAESLAGDPENFFGYGAYASPEARQGAADYASDVYSVGRLLSFVMLDQTPEVDADLAEIDAKVPELSPIIRRSTGPVAYRHPSMAELHAELQRCRQRLAPTGSEMAKRAAPEVLPRPRATAGTDLPAPARPARKSAAPWWVAVVAAVALLASVGVAQVLLIRSPLLQFVLQGGVVAAFVGLTAAVPMTLGIRVLVTVVAAAIGIGANPIGRLSRLEADDSATRGDAARAFVRAGGKDLRKKRFQGANLSGLDLTDAELGSADLTSASFVGSKLKNAHVQGTSLILANFSGADLTGVALENASGVETALCDAATVFPVGWHCSAESRVKRGAAP